MKKKFYAEKSVNGELTHKLTQNHLKIIQQVRNLPYPMLETLKSYLTPFRPIRLARPSNLNSDINTPGSFFGCCILRFERDKSVG